MSVVCDNLPGSAEDEVKGVSTDEEDVTVRPPPRITSSGIFSFLGYIFLNSRKGICTIFV